MALTAQKGVLTSEKNNSGSYGHLKLTDGQIHQSNPKAHTKVSFSENLVNLYDPIKSTFSAKNVLSMSLEDLRNKLNSTSTKPKEQLQAKIEINKRWALSVVNILFALIGFALATLVQKRQAKSNGLVICVGLLVLYWVLFILSLIHI